MVITLTRARARSMSLPSPIARWLVTTSTSCGHPPRLPDAARVFVLHRTAALRPPCLAGPGSAAFECSTSTMPSTCRRHVSSAPPNVGDGRCTGIPPGVFSAFPKQPYPHSSISNWICQARRGSPFDFRLSISATLVRMTASGPEPGVCSALQRSALIRMQALCAPALRPQRNL